MLENNEGHNYNINVNLNNLSMCRTNSVRSRAANHFSKSLEVTRFQSQYEEEINELREQIITLE